MAIALIKVQSKNDINRGDILLIDDGQNIEAVTARRIIDQPEREVVFDLRKNRYFNVDMYLRGESWVKDLQIVRSTADGGNNVR